MTTTGRTNIEWSQGYADWNCAVARAMESASPHEACRAIGTGLAKLFDGDTWYILFFRRDETPVMFDYFDADTRKDRYEEGPYLLDPFYTAFLNGDPEGCYLKSDISPEDLSEIEPYFSYDSELFGPMDEVGLVSDIDQDTRSLVCFARAKGRMDSVRFGPRHLVILESIAPIIRAVVRKTWAEIGKMNLESQSARAANHSRIDTFFRSFGSDRLTARETEIGNLMIKGFNAREIGVLLDISYGTARNHIKKVYLKLDVSSQSELCGLFIEQLLNS